MALKKVQPIVEEPPQRHGEERPKHGDSHDEGNWLISYADMMTLLCGFFIMLFSMAKLDDPKYDSFKEAVVKHFGGNYATPAPKELAKFMTQLLQEMGLAKEMMVRSDSGSAVVTFQSTVFFDTLSASVKPEGKAIIYKLIDTISQHQEREGKQYRIVVEGHTDSRPVVGGSFPSNWELSGSRAASVIRMFLERGYLPANLTAIGYADTRPAYPARKADGSFDEEALGKNRRVVLRILEPRVEAIPYPETAKAMTPYEAASAAREPIPAGEAPTRAPAAAEAPPAAPAAPVKADVQPAAPAVTAPPAAPATNPPAAASAPAQPGSAANPRWVAPKAP